MNRGLVVLAVCVVLVAASYVGGQNCKKDCTVRHFTITKANPIQCYQFEPLAHNDDPNAGQTGGNYGGVNIFALKPDGGKSVLDGVGVKTDVFDCLNKCINECDLVKELPTKARIITGSLCNALNISLFTYKCVPAGTGGQ